MEKKDSSSRPLSNNFVGINPKAAGYRGAHTLTKLGLDTSRRQDLERPTRDLTACALKVRMEVCQVRHYGVN